jgi:CBS domain-containing protein
MSLGHEVEILLGLPTMDIILLGTFEKRNIKVEKIMSTNIASLDISKTAAHASNLMTERRVGSVIVTKNGKAFGIVTERDLVRRYSRSTILASLASYPLITAMPSTTIEKVVDIMLKNEIRKPPIIDERKIIVGIVTVSDLAMFLLPLSNSDLTSSVLKAVSRGKTPRCDSCNSQTEIQWCESCSRFMCIACEDEIHTVDLP